MNGILLDKALGGKTEWNIYWKYSRKWHTQYSVFLFVYIQHLFIGKCNRIISYTTSILLVIILKHTWCLIDRGCLRYVVIVNKVFFFLICFLFQGVHLGFPVFLSGAHLYLYLPKLLIHCFSLSHLFVNGWHYRKWFSTK